MYEKRYRSLLKGITWRFVGTLDTTILSWFFTGFIAKALQIGGIEFFTKIILYYLHERVWQRIRWARHVVGNDDAPTTREGHRRSIVKGISWRITGTVDTMVIAFLVTGKVAQAVSIGLAEIVTKILLYYLHERVWQRITLGRLPPREWETGGGI